MVGEIRGNAPSISRVFKMFRVVRLIFFEYLDMSSTISVSLMNLRGSGYTSSDVSEIFYCGSSGLHDRSEFLNTFIFDFGKHPSMSEMLLVWRIMFNLRLWTWLMSATFRDNGSFAGDFLLDKVAPSISPV